MKPYLTATLAQEHTVLQERASSSWLHVVTHLDPKYGGLSTVVPQLCSSLGDGGACTAKLAAFCLPKESGQPAGYPELPASIWPTSRWEWMRSRRLAEQFRAEAAEADGLHIHGLWEQSTEVAANTARRLRKPYVVSAHGMLEPWALASKRAKKAVYAALFEHRNVRGAACLHALTPAEAENYRAFGARGPIAVIPNGVTVPEVLDAEPFLAGHPELRGRRLVLFLGRLHSKKGLDLLVESWAAVAKGWPEAHLVLAGPDSEGTQARMEAKIAAHGVGAQVSFTGMLGGAMKWSALAAAEGFVLPSYSEGLSTAVLEAMGAGLPVIVTRQCNVPEVEIHKTGWQIESKIDQLTFSLNDLLVSSSEIRAGMGVRGKKLVREQYGWPSVAQRMREVYSWVAGGPEPLSVELQRYSS